MSIRLFWIGITFLAVPASFVAAPYPTELLLQHVPTLVGLVLLTIATARFQVSLVSFVCSLSFLWIHLIGARWIYSFVPYDEWSTALTGYSISEVFGWERNHYDRMVHLTSGLLGLPVFSELLQTYCRLRPLPAGLLALSCVLAIGAAYEVLEWQIAIVFSPAMAESYNGQQGDVWDAQKDLALAWLGATLCLPVIYDWTPSSVGNGDEI
ncbi:putative membrane protein [Neorhodopirellula lusitana]|uniref:Membrane protein n=1 Tax=Neorhodopirellula lusitana TaxID=445327 RepID=A0ABY1QMB2_9BACT|nr:DUF2238 domain-containing protein [Neorhodopirellula lusitana]SMP75448.1 putative membrane protein [Neorhodopirellula lusitana]